VPDKAAKRLEEVALSGALSFLALQEFGWVAWRKRRGLADALARRSPKGLSKMGLAWKPMACRAQVIAPSHGAQAVSRATRKRRRAHSRTLDAVEHRGRMAWLGAPQQPGGGRAGPNYDGSLLLPTHPNS